MDNIEIKTAKETHFSFLEEHDSHISIEMLKSKIEREEILVMELNGKCIGWLRYGLFWDEIPFMNMLYFIEEYRRKGYGNALVKFWETMLLEKGFRMFLTSTLANEEAQFFYRKQGYTDIGGFILPSQPLEIMLMKDMS